MENLDKGLVYAFLSQNAHRQVNKAVAGIVGIIPALLLSDLISKEKFYSDRGLLTPDGFFYATVEAVKETTTLGKDSQLANLKALIKAGVVVQKLKGTPATRHFKIDFDKLIDLLRKAYKNDDLKLEENPPTGWRNNRQQDGGKSATSNNRYNKKEVINKIYDDPDFIEFWELYPKGDGKQKAAENFGKVPAAEIPNLMEGLKAWNSKRSIEGTEDKYIPHGATWIYQERRKDKIKVSKPKKKKASNAHTQDHETIEIEEGSLDDILSK